MLKTLFYCHTLQDNAIRRCSTSTGYRATLKTLFYYYRLQDNARDAVLLLQITGQC